MGKRALSEDVGRLDDELGKVDFSILLLCLLACSAGAPADKTDSMENTMSSPVAFRVVESGEYGAAANSSPGPDGSAPVIEIARDGATYRALWQKHVGSGPGPSVDFSKETAVFLVLGMRSSGGYGISPSEVTVQSGTATVKAEVRAPRSGSMVATVITSPFAVIAVSAREVQRAEWRVKERAEPLTRSREPK